MLALVITACAGPVQPEKQPHRIANNDPVLTPLVAETGGKRVRMARPGATVEIHARASDADGDRLRYRWVPTAGSGTVKPVSASAVRWTIGKGEGDKRLMVVVSDGRGGSARGTLRLPTRSDIVFSGMVVTNDGKPIAAAVVDVNGETATTDRRGRFRLPIEKANAPRFILNIRKWGYGLVSRIYDQSIHDGRWIVTRATVTTIDPTQPATVTDTSSQSECTGSLTSGIDWNNYPVQRIPRMIDSFGQLSGGAIPNDITQALTVIFGGTGCSPGISITIPPNSLVDAAGNPPTGTVDVAVSTVDLYAPFAMPGDYSVRVKEGARWMQSFGAGTVEIRSGNTPYRLKPGAAARLTIPVDPTQMKTGAKIPDSIPLLLYDEGRGVWQMTGGAAVDARGSAYVALIDHLSAYNTDLIKTDQACVRFKGDGLISAGGVPGEFELDVIIPLGSAAPVVRHWQISPSTDPLHADDPDLHVVINLPSNTWITFVPMRQEAGGLVPYGIFGVNSGPPQTPTDPNFPPFPYAACQNELTLTDVSGALDIVVDGAGQNFGPLPTFPYILMNAAGTDHYPVGSGEFYIFGLFDTGSNIVRISQATANVLAMGTASTTNASQNVNVRLNGMATINTTTLGAPIGPPGFPEQQAEVTGVRAGIRSDEPDLIGAPVTNGILALIDNATTVTRGPYTFLPPGSQNVSGPDMTFFDPGDAGIPVPDLTLQLERWGSTTPAITDSATVGQRYWLHNVVFQHGNNVVADEQNAADPFNFMFDTGTTVTIVNDSMAGLLGLSSLTASFSCLGGTNNGYSIDSVTMLGTDGSYRIENASICWRESAIRTPQLVDAVIGSNFFTQVRILFDGPNNTLGILQ